MSRHPCRAGTTASWAPATPSSNRGPRTHRSSRPGRRSNASSGHCWARSRRSGTAALLRRSGPQAAACGRESARRGSRRSRPRRDSPPTAVRLLRGSSCAARRRLDDRVPSAGRPANRAGTRRRHPGRPVSCRSKAAAALRFSRSAARAKRRPGRNPGSDGAASCASTASRRTRAPDSVESSVVWLMPSHGSSCPAMHSCSVLAEGGHQVTKKRNSGRAFPHALRQSRYRGVTASAARGGGKLPMGNARTAPTRRKVRNHDVYSCLQVQWALILRPACGAHPVGCPIRIEKGGDRWAIWFRVENF